jgi:class 3 adenylate cyclase/tetratricopeptide (TPR) repeat protein
MFSCLTSRFSEFHFPACKATLELLQTHRSQLGEHRELALENKLSAILVMDVVGYSRMMGADEAGTLSRLKELRAQTIHPMIANFKGRIVKLMGDGTLVEFPSARHAVECAVEIQKSLSAKTANDIRFRIGINFDNVITDGDDIYGDAVNIAARLEGMADPDGILISQMAHDAVIGNLSDEFFDNGARKFKNIDKPIRVWSWPKKLPSLRAQGKPSIFVDQILADRISDEKVGHAIQSELFAHLSRLTGSELVTEREKAHYLVRGSVRTGSGKSRVYAQLLDAESNQQLWSDRFDNSTDDEFDIVDACVPGIAMTLRRMVAANEATRLQGQAVDELGLEELLSLASVQFYRPTKEGWLSGGIFAEQALEIEPENFMALSMAAAGKGAADFLYTVRAPKAVDVNLAFERIKMALRINNRSDMLHTTHAALLLFGARDHLAADSAANQALAINPDYNMGLWISGAIRVFSGQPEEGAELAARAVNLNEQDPYVHHYSRIAGLGFLSAGMFGDALTWFQKADSLAPGLAPNLMGIVATCTALERPESAVSALSALLTEDPDFRLSTCLPLPYTDTANWEKYVELLRAAGAPE